MARTTRVSSTIEIAMLPVMWSKKTRMMKKNWKIGVNSQATNPKRLSGFAGASGIAAGGSDADADADADGTALAPGAGVGAGKQATATSRMKIARTVGQNQAGGRPGRNVTLGIFKGPGRIRRGSPGGIARSASFPASCP